ncbi:MAG: GspH/FimT family pseudopilin [Betaproteobacteria bacterium]
MRRRASAARGFTLPELIMVLVIIAALAALAIPQFVTTRGFASRGFYVEALGVVRFAQKTAIAWRRPITVCVAATEISAIANANCAAPVTLAHPTTGGLLRATAPSGVTLAPVGSFSFDGLGRPTPALTIVVSSTIVDDPARQIVVAVETGYVSR